jgi:hypothetical protein
MARRLIRHCVDYAQKKPHAEAGSKVRRIRFSDERLPSLRPEGYLGAVFRSGSS